jgi:hypothetical protein
MIVHTEPIEPMSLPSRSRRRRPRSKASATSRHWGREKQTVALMLMPRYVASSMAGIPALGDGDLDDHVGREPREVLGLADDRLRIAIEPRVGLHRQAAVAPPVRLEDGLQQRRGGRRQLVDDRPCDLVLGRGRLTADELQDAVLPKVHLLFQHLDDDDGVAGGADGAVLDGISELLHRRRVVPEARPRRLGHLVEGTLVHGCRVGHDYPRNRGRDNL